MDENINNLLYIKAKKIRKDLLLYIEKNIKKNQQNENKIKNLLSLKKNNMYQKESMKVSFQEIYIEKNTQIITQELENNKNKIIPNLSSESFFHISEKSLCSYKFSSPLSTAESINQNKKNKNNFLNEKSKTITKNIFILENNKNKFPIDYENINKNKNIKTFNGNLIVDCKKNKINGKKYLINLSKYLGLINHNKKKAKKNSSIKNYGFYSKYFIFYKYIYMKIYLY